MNKCETCKHWAEESEIENPVKVKACLKTPMLWDSCEWNDECDRVLIDEFKDHKAFVQDGSDYRATLFTRADFGCVQWEEKA